jgi:hypothetical protein
VVQLVLAPLAAPSRPNKLQTLVLDNLVQLLPPVTFHTILDGAQWSELQRLHLPVLMTRPCWEALAKACPHLRDVHIAWSTWATRPTVKVVLDDALLRFVAASWPAMESFQWNTGTLGLIEWTATDAGWSTLTAWSSLHNLQVFMEEGTQLIRRTCIRGAGLSEQGLIDCLASWPRLEHLWIDTLTGTTSRILTALNQHCPHLTHLYNNWNDKECQPVDVVRFVRAHRDLVAMPTNNLDDQKEVQLWTGEVVRALGSSCRRFCTFALPNTCVCDDVDIVAVWQGCPGLYLLSATVSTIGDLPCSMPHHQLEHLTLHVQRSVNLSDKTLECLATTCPALDFLHIVSAHVIEPNIEGVLDVTVAGILGLVTRCRRLAHVWLLALPLAKPICPRDLLVLLHYHPPVALTMRFRFLSWAEPAWLADSVKSAHRASIGHRLVDTFSWVEHEFTPLVVKQEKPRRILNERQDDEDSDDEQ